jgi:hypothetical protein
MWRVEVLQLPQHAGTRALIMHAVSSEGNLQKKSLAKNRPFST